MINFLNNFCFLATNTNTNHQSYNVPWFLYAILIAVLAIYAFIEFIHTKHDHKISLKEATTWSVIYIVSALLFAVPIFIFIGKQAGAEYLAAWAMEKALSLDNLFIIGIIFASFKVPLKLERRMLNYGIAGAIVFRLIFIFAGFTLLKTFAWVSIIFGIIIMLACIKNFKNAVAGEDTEEMVITEKRVWKMITKLLPIHHKFDGHKFITKINGKHMLTMMGAIIILIELTDIIFAVDSVPAVLAISPDFFIAFSSNIFAILGLRALFFVYQSVSEKFWAIEWGLTGILAWISFKMIVAPDYLPFGIKWIGLHIPVALSLSILGVLFAASISASLFIKNPNSKSN